MSIGRICKNLLQLVTVAALLCSAPLFAQTAPPRLFFSDLESGPDTGGENGKGDG